MPLYFWHSCARDLLHRSQRRALSPRNSAGTAAGAGAPRGANPPPCILQFFRIRRRQAQGWQAPGWGRVPFGESSLPTAFS